MEATHLTPSPIFFLPQYVFFSRQLLKQSSNTEQKRNRIIQKKDPDAIKKTNKTITWAREVRSTPEEKSLIPNNGVPRYLLRQRVCS